MGFQIFNSDKKMTETENSGNIYDVAIIGGGLAGLSLATLLAKKCIHVLVIEKDSYPRQKVCGEYIAMESWNFLENLGLDLNGMDLPLIDTFRISFLPDKLIECQLKPGGFGISRFTLDHKLAKIAEKKGVQILTNSKVDKINKTDHDNLYELKTHNGNTFYAKLAIGAAGRGGFSKILKKKEKKYFAVKYHINTEHSENIIEIHNFKGGYCGISKVDKEKYCMCYLSDASALKEFNGNIDLFEKTVLTQNNYLKNHLEKAEKITDPITTSGFYFGMNAPFWQDIPLIGDSAGFIPPISGNGMSLAFRSAAHLYKIILEFLTEKISYNELCTQHQLYCNKYLSNRINKGIFLQNLVLKDNCLKDQFLYSAFKYIPGLLSFLSKQAVGKEIRSE